MADKTCPFKQNDASTPAYCPDLNCNLYSDGKNRCVFNKIADSLSVIIGKLDDLTSVVKKAK